MKNKNYIVRHENEFIKKKLRAYAYACTVRKGIFKQCLLSCVELIIAFFLGNYSKAKKLRFKYSVELCYFKLTIVEV